MGRALIKLVYKQLINASSTGMFERDVFKATYNEFKLKSQTYNMEGKFKTFTELKANDGRANSLHYKISFAAAYFIEGLNNRIPELVDNLGDAIAFDVAKFELIQSDLTDSKAHNLAINYSTDILTLCDIVGEYLILAKGDVGLTEPAETFVLKLQPNLSISEFHIVDQSTRNTYVPIHANN
ncbi:MAG: hypothetical protein JWR50_2558 [Mucilaginibacter sp.]|nr:hypothetical protein [Mucilaginibacter sp.]